MPYCFEPRVLSKRKEERKQHLTHISKIEYSQRTKYSLVLKGNMRSDTIYFYNKCLD